MFIIGETAVAEEIATARFACDTGSCKGACCHLPGCRGAPLSDGEAALLGSIVPAVRKYLSAGHRDILDRERCVEGLPGDRATTCVDDADCIFVFREDGIARCAIEKAYMAGETEFRKPISCHLFPIRVSRGHMESLRYERIEECEAGRRRGAAAGIPLKDFLKDALVRKYGPEWFAALTDACGPGARPE